MSIEDNKAIVRSLIDGLFTRGDLAVVDTYLATDFVMHDPPVGVSPDREGNPDGGGDDPEGVPGLAQRPARPGWGGRPRRRTVHRLGDTPGRVHGHRTNRQHRLPHSHQ